MARKVFLFSASEIEYLAKILKYTKNVACPRGFKRKMRFHNSILNKVIPEMEMLQKGK